MPGISNSEPTIEINVNNRYHWVAANATLPYQELCRLAGLDERTAGDVVYRLSPWQVGRAEVGEAVPLKRGAVYHVAK